MLTVSIMQLPVINATIILSAGLVLGALYGMIAGKQRLRLLILSIYVGIVISNQLTDAVKPYVTLLSREQLSWAMLGLPILVFGFFGVVHAKNHAKGAAIANIVVGLLTAALITSSVLTSLPTSTQSYLKSDSFLAIHLLQIHPWLLGLLPVVALVLGFIKSEKGHH
jgi:hypothetical protein